MRREIPTEWPEWYTTLQRGRTTGSVTVSRLAAANSFTPPAQGSTTGPRSNWLPVPHPELILRSVAYLPRVVRRPGHHAARNGRDPVGDGWSEHGGLFAATGPAKLIDEFRSPVAHSQSVNQSALPGLASKGLPDHHPLAIVNPYF